MRALRQDCAPGRSEPGDFSDDGKGPDRQTGREGRDDRGPHVAGGRKPTTIRRTAGGDAGLNAGGAGDGEEAGARGEGLGPWGQAMAWRWAPAGALLLVVSGVIDPNDQSAKASQEPGITSTPGLERVDTAVRRLVRRSWVAEVMVRAGMSHYADSWRARFEVCQPCWYG
jgi:hypothetical protein